MAKRIAFPLGLEMKLLSEQSELNPLSSKLNSSRSMHYPLQNYKGDFCFIPTNDRKSLNIEKKNEYVEMFKNKMLDSVRKIKTLNNFHLQIIRDLGASEEFFYRKKSTTFQTFHQQQRQLLSDIKKFLINQMEKLPLIHPGSWTKLFWDIAAVISRLYFLYIIPIDLAWVHQQLIFQELYGFSLFFFLIIMLDLLISLNTAYFKNGELVIQKSKIIKNSLLNTYGLQWLSVLQLLLYFLISSSFSISLNVENNPINIGLLLFLVHHKTVINCATDYEEGLNLSKQTSSILALFKLIAFLFYVIHLISCLWFWIGQYGVANYEKSWLITTNTEDLQWSSQYLQSFYYTAVTIFTVGYGDITPQSSLEKIVTIILIMISSMQLPFSINTIGSIITEMTAFSQEKKRKFRIINSYMNQQKISSNLQMQIRQYLTYVWENMKVSQSDQERDIIDSLSEYLQQQIINEAHSQIFQQCSLFKLKFSEAFKRQLIKHVEEVLLSPEQELTSKRDQLLYFIEEGQIEICLLQGRKIHLGTVSKGTSLGLRNFIIGINPKETYKSIGFTKAMVLKRKRFLKILQDFPEDYEVFCSLKDQLLFDNEHQPFKQQCFSCHQNTHKLIECPLLNYIPNKEIILKRHQYPTQQNRKQYIRIMKKRNTLKQNKKIMEQAALLLQKDEPPLMQIYKYDNIANIEEESKAFAVNKAHSLTTFQKLEGNKQKNQKLYIEIDPLKQKFRQLVKKVISINTFYPAFLLHTYSQFEKMIEQRIATQTLQILNYRIKNISQFNTPKLTCYLNDIEFMIAKLTEKKYIDDEDFEAPKNYNWYLTSGNFVFSNQYNFTHKLTILKQFLRYFQYPGTIIKQFNLSTAEIPWIRKRKQGFCVSADVIKESKSNSQQ